MAKDLFRVEGFKELERSIRRLGKVPQRHVTSSSRKGMNVVLKDAKQRAPEQDGYLKKGMRLKGERSRQKAKKVYQVTFDPRWNHVFQKKNKDGQITGYYPVSQEYGFFARDGKYIPGYRFIHNALNNNVRTVEKTIVSEMKKKIDAELRKGGL